MPTKTTYTIEYSYGRIDPGYATYEDAVAEVRAMYGDAEIGHSGDLADGGDRTLVWRDAESAANDDGRRAFAEIRAEPHRYL